MEYLLMFWAFLPSMSVISSFLVSNASSSTIAFARPFFTAPKEDSSSSKIPISCKLVSSRSRSASDPDFFQNELSSLSVVRRSSRSLRISEDGRNLVCLVGITGGGTKIGPLEGAHGAPGIPGGGGCIKIKLSFKKVEVKNNYWRRWSTNRRR